MMLEVGRYFIAMLIGILFSESCFYKRRPSLKEKIKFSFGLLQSIWFREFIS